MPGLISDAVKSVRDNASQKIKSPLFGAFAFSWLAYNWKPVSIFLLSKENVYERINNVSAYASLNDQFYYPILTSLLLVFIIPLFNACYSFFDVCVKFVHESSESLRLWFSSYIDGRKERSQAQADMKKELTLADERKKIALINKEAADAERQEAIIRTDIGSLAELESARLALKEHESKINDKIKNLEIEYNLIGRKFKMLRDNADYVISNSDAILTLIRNDSFNDGDQEKLASMIEDIKVSTMRARSGTVLS